MRGRGLVLHGYSFDVGAGPTDVCVRRGAGMRGLRGVRAVRWGGCSLAGARWGGTVTGGAHLPRRSSGGRLVGGMEAARVRMPCESGSGRSAFHGDARAAGFAVVERADPPPGRRVRSPSDVTPSGCPTGSTTRGPVG